VLSALYSLARPALFKVPPEDAHELMLKSMEAGAYPRATGTDPACLAQDVWGCRFPNPAGIAAGFDKNARVPDAILGLGCGFAEAGTLTPEPQDGNPAPRVFRLVADNALINRLGFNNGGHKAALARLERRARTGTVAVNIGANKDSSDRVNDYVRGIDTFYDVASFFTVNISSPNTPGLRDLQAPAALDELLSHIMAARQRHVELGKPKRAIVVKIAPDIAEADFVPMIAQLVAHGADGIAVSNTTLARGALKDPHAREAGGLSGRPLFQRSTIMLARTYQETGGKIPLIGIGGIDSGETALAKIEAGATLIQLYTGLIYEGPGLIGRIKDHLAAVCRREGVASISELRGRRAAEWAAKPLD
jgi:dihydroorotate dehydrogenase